MGKLVNEVDKNYFDLLKIVNSVHVFNSLSPSLSDSPVEIKLIAKKLGYWLAQNIMLF